MKVVLIITLLSAVLTSGQENICYKNFPVISDLKPSDCTNGQYYFEYVSSTFCLPACRDVSKSNKCGKTSPCTPGFKCVKNSCVVDEDSCLKYYNTHKGVTNKYEKAYIKPQCDKNGQFAAKQCKGDSANGRCYCYDAVGNKIYGEEWSDLASKMTCACSRKKAEMRKNPTASYVSLHCDKQGNFEPLQCYANLCWCVDGPTGDITSKVVPESHMTMLPCYKRQIVGEKYLRKCESGEHANFVISKKLLDHGTQYPNLPRISCDDDGSYSPIDIKNGIATCVWTDGTPIGSYQSQAQHMKNMNCKCARDKKSYEEAGKTFFLDCENNGNYLYEQQTQDGKYYCIDSDGHKIHDDYKDTLPSVAECAEYITF